MSHAYRGREKAIELLQGVATVIALFAAGWFLPFVWVANRGSSDDWPQAVLGVCSILAAGVAVGLTIRWWTRARWRAYGVLSALVGPPVLGVLLVILFFAAGGQIGPR